MSSQSLSRYIVTFHFHESGLSDILELASTMTSSGFTTTLIDDEGHPHELGTNSFGIVSPLGEDELKQQATAIGESVLGQQPEVTLTTLDAFLRDAADKSSTA